MERWKGLLDDFILQAHSGDLKVSRYPKEWEDLKMKVSFGMGAPARVPWIGFLAPEMRMSNGINPVYLYYKDLSTLVLAYGVGEDTTQSWPAEVMNSASTIDAFFDMTAPRYGDSFVFRAYKVKVDKKNVTYTYTDNENEAKEKDLESDLTTIITYFKKLLIKDSGSIPQEISTGIFYMEKQLEDFIIHNWDHTELGKKYNLIIEQGELLSQQYKTDIGPIDILATDKNTGDYVVIELKKNQTSDDTVGQVARYMGWIREKKGKKVRGVIIAAEYDRRLEYALKVIDNVEVFLYQVDFKLRKFGND